MIRVLNHSRREVFRDFAVFSLDSLSFLLNTFYYILSGMSLSKIIAQKPTRLTVVIMGITGDLAQAKLVPALYGLYRAGELPKTFSLIGFSRKEYSEAQFAELVRNAVVKKFPNEPAEKVSQFVKSAWYYQGQFDDTASYRTLADRINFAQIGDVSAVTLINLSVPPALYPTILKQYQLAGFSAKSTPISGTVRFMIEKPFGANVGTAKDLYRTATAVREDADLFLIDHYLGKEALQNIVAFRFANSLFESLWNHTHIERIECRLLEKTDVSTRGAFYDGVGALSDVVQNHVLQMLAHIVMDEPKKTTAKAVREARAKALGALSLALGNRRADTHGKQMVRAQYEGYLATPGVASLSTTETFVRVIAKMDSGRFKNVPLILEAGKAVAESVVDIKLYFKTEDQKFCVIDESGESYCQNVLTFRIQPNEGISTVFWVKRPGFTHDVLPKKLAFNYSEDTTHPIRDAYERIYFDAILGDQTRFVSIKEVLASWQFVEKARAELSKLPIVVYKKGSSAEGVGC
ncbi:MAG: hypothetical protein RLZZ347_170 [Candidatus Parcubacteria bacterium]|jgi:glucose-6-phosphate 1-dehydrogenase